MPRASANSLEIEYETFGDSTRPAVLLISGLGSQLIGWTDGLCQEIAARGFQVIRFDNRDVGLSTKLEGAPEYSLSDMAADAAGLLGALGINAAHVVGASMGGMIAQLVAIEHPARTLSLTVVMSNLGGTDSISADPETIAVLFEPPADNREDRIEQSVAASRITWGPSFDEDRSRARSTRAVDRSFYPEGTVRQFRALSAAGSRREALAGVSVPVLVVHGDGDPLVPFANAERIVAAAPAGAELHVMKGVGHDLPPWEWASIADGIARLAAKLEPGVGVAER
ncbi:MAG: alpha/beta fold hydrolase [Candidatus Dormibacteraeota bacterium]|nr:alpha/beta fold hydrolase [Candidatus Dormibacteraeota bacterium]